MTDTEECVILISCPCLCGGTMSSLGLIAFLYQSCKMDLHHLSRAHANLSRLGKLNGIYVSSQSIRVFEKHYCG